MLLSAFLGAAFGCSETNPPPATSSRTSATVPSTPIATSSSTSATVSPAPTAGEGTAVRAPDERIGVTPTEVLIGSCIDQSGTLKERGQQIILGAHVYFESVNEHGGVNGRHIKLAVCDDHYDAETAITCFNTCLKGRVFAGAFFAGSAPASKYVRMGELDELPLLGFCTGAPMVYAFHPTRFIVRAGFADEVEKQIDTLWRDKGVRRIAVIYQNDAYGAAIRETVGISLQKYGSSAVAEASYPRETVDVDAAVKTVMDTRPQVVILGANSDALKAIIQKKTQNGWSTLFTTFSVGTDYLLDLGKAADGTVVTEIMPVMDRRLPSVTMCEELCLKYAPQSKVNPDALEGFVNAMVIVEGLKRAGPDLTRSKFIHALESVHDMDLGLGPEFRLNYGPQMHHGLTSSSVHFEIMRGGKLFPMTDADWKLVLQPVP